MTDKIIPETFDQVLDVIFEDFLGMAAYFAKSTVPKHYKNHPLNGFAGYLLQEFRERLEKRQYPHPERVERTKDSTSSSSASESLPLSGVPQKEQ